MYSEIIPVVLFLFYQVHAQRLHEQIYSPIEGSAACFRRLNGTHQVGCSTSEKGSVGVVHFINTLSDAEWVTTNSSAGPYIGVVNTALFYDVIETFISHSDNIAGVVVYDNATESPKSFTEESRCPNEYASGPGSKCSSATAGGIVWNDKGTGLLRRDLPFPIFYLPQTRYEEIEKIEKCFKMYNEFDMQNQKGRQLCSVQLTSFNFAAVNTEVCLRRVGAAPILSSIKVCDPLGDQNVYYSLFPRGKDAESASKSVTLVTARLDTATLFDGLAPGAASTVVGLVTLITSATLLSKIIPQEDANLYKHNIMWTLFNGEAFDYIGSQRVAYDLKHGVWPPSSPLNVSQIKLHVEVGQIGGSLLPSKDNVSWPLYAVAPYTSSLPTEVNEFLIELSSNLNRNNMSVSPIFDTNVPPSSLHSFRRILENETQSGDLPEILLADFKETFSNMFYNSPLDNYANIAFAYHNISVDSNGTFMDTDALIAGGEMKESDMQVKVARVATALAHTLYQRVVGTAYTGDLNASAHLVDELLYCLTRNQSCRAVRAADYAGGAGAAAGAAPLYISVTSWQGAAAVLAGHLLALLTGRHAPADDHDQCNGMTNQNYTYYWLNGWNSTGVCIETTMNFTQAISPAFTIPGYSLKSGEFSSWSESVWQSLSARVFVAASGGGARAAAGAAAAACLLALLLTYWLRAHATLLFGDHSAPSAAGILRSVNC